MNEFLAEVWDAMKHEGAQGVALGILKAGGFVIAFALLRQLGVPSDWALGVAVVYALA